MKTTCIYHIYIAFINHMLIGVDKDMTPIDIEVIGSKVKVRRIIIVKNGFPSVSEELFISKISYFTC